MMKRLWGFILDVTYEWPVVGMEHRLDKQEAVARELLQSAIPALLWAGLFSEYHPSRACLEVVSGEKVNGQTDLFVTEISVTSICPLSSAGGWGEIISLDMPPQEAAQAIIDNVRSMPRKARGQ